MKSGNKKLFELQDLLEELDVLKGQGKKIVFTNGCFDLVHAGHVHCLKQARSFGDVLVIGLNSDSSVSRLKGQGRPIFEQQDRACILGAFEFVDYLVSFDEDTPEKLIESVKPDVLVKGSDYTIEGIVGAEFVASYGGEVRRCELIEGRSTSELIKRIKEI